MEEIKKEGGLEVDEQVELVLEEIRPSLVRDGGDIEYFGVDEKNRVKVRLTGACGTCPSAIFTLRMGIENHIKQKIPWVEGIIEV